jgi:hypothetical protein
MDVIRNASTIAVPDNTLIAFCAPEFIFREIPAETEHLMKKLLIVAGTSLMLLSSVVAVAFAQGHSPAQQCAAAGFGAGNPLHSACVVCVAQGFDLETGTGVTLQCACKILVAEGLFSDVGACHQALGG